MKKIEVDIKVIVITALLALGLWAWANSAYREVDAARLQAIADHQAAVLEAAGWKKVASQSAEEIPLPDLEEEVQAADEAETDIAVAVSSNSQEAVVNIPLPPRPSPSATPGVAEAMSPEGEAGSTTGEDFFALTVKPSLQMRVDLDATGNMFYTGKILVKLSLPDGNFENISQHPLVDAKIALGDKVQQALKNYYERPPRFTFRLRRPRHVRFGWSAGVGVSYHPTHGLYPTTSVLWGVQF